MNRRKKIGDLGEGWAKNLLAGAGFRMIEDLNAVRSNHPGGDFLAERQGKRYFVTVKARNKYVRGSWRLNSGYNIYPEKVRRAADEYRAIPAWLTIQIDADRRCYSAYFGTIDSLRNPSTVAVPMTPKAVAHYECLAFEQICPEITNDLSNQVRQRKTLLKQEPRMIKHQPRHRTALSKAEIGKLREFVKTTVAGLRNAPSRPDLEGAPSGIVFTLLRLNDKQLAQKVGSRKKLVSIAEELGFTIRSYPGGIGRAGSGVWETIDLPT